MQPPWALLGSARGFIAEAILLVKIDLDDREVLILDSRIAYKLHLFQGSLNLKSGDR